MTSRRRFLGTALTLAATACTTGPFMTQYPPIVFVHGNGDSAALWQTTIWRFESNGWPRDRLFAIDLPYPTARAEDDKPEPGRSSTAEYMAFLRAEVDKVLQATGARQVVLVGNSRGGYAIRNYIQNGGGSAKVSHAVLGGVPNHGVWNVPGRAPANEFAGNGPFLRGLNAPKDASGAEVAGPVQWLTIRSDNNDKYAQPLGTWIGDAKLETGVGYDGPALKGATNVVLTKVDHRETSFSPQAFAATWRFLTGREPATLDIVPEDRIVLRGRVTGLGVSSTDPASGNVTNNLPIPGARVEIFAVDPASGQRKSPAAHSQVVAADGQWGPFQAQRDMPYEFVVGAAGYATTHIYRSPFPRSSSVVHLRPERIPETDRAGPSLVIFTRPRGYFDPARDRMAFDGQSPPPGVLPGAGVSASRIKPNGPLRAVAAEFNGEKVVGRTWPTANNEVSVLELTY